MSATVIDEKLQTTLPADVCKAAGLGTSDQVDWRFEDGEIHGRKKQLQGFPRQVTARLILQGGMLVFKAEGVTIDAEDIEKAVAEERESR